MDIHSLTKDIDIYIGEVKTYNDSLYTILNISFNKKDQNRIIETIKVRIPYEDIPKLINAKDIRHSMVTNTKTKETILEYIGLIGDTSLKIGN